MLFINFFKTNFCERIVKNTSSKSKI